MKFAFPLVAIFLMMLAGCSFDASSRPIQPTPPTVVGNDGQAYCCAHCGVGEDQAKCVECRRSSAASCPAESHRLVCVSNVVEVPDAEAASTLTVDCF